MPRVAKELSALDVKRLKHPQTRANPVAKAVGGVAGLYLQMSASGARSWLLKAQLMSGKRRELGLGPYPEVSLADAREEAREIKAQIRTGVDPILERQKLRAELIAQERAALTFTGAMDAYVDYGELNHYSTDKSRALWISSMQTHVLPYIGEMRVGDIKTADVLEMLVRISDWFLGNYVQDYRNSGYTLAKRDKQEATPPAARPAQFKRGGQYDSSTGNPTITGELVGSTNKNKPKIGLFGRVGKAIPLNIPVTPSV